MTRRKVLCLLAGGLILGCAALATAANPGTVAADEAVLQEVNVGTDGAALLAFFRKLSSPVSNEARVQSLLRALGDDDYAVREDASRRLVEMGPSAAAFLKAAVKNSDIEVVRRAEACLADIERLYSGAVIASAARLLAMRKPAGMAEVLLDWLPRARDEQASEEARLALTEVARRAGQPEPALLKALTDESGSKRAGAGAALARAEVEAARPAVRKLLQDPDPQVRLRVGLALAATKDEKAVPVLIDLLDKVPAGQSWLIEDLLFHLTAYKGPSLTGRSEAAWHQYREDWAKWWTEHGSKVAMKKIEPVRLLGYTMVVLLDEGRILELDGAQKVRWELTGIQFPLDVQYLPGDHILVAEQGVNRVTERNLKGEVVWEKKLLEPLSAQRLPNGNTFVTTRGQLLEFDSSGKEVFNVSRPNGDLFMRAQRLPQGDIVCATQHTGGVIQCVWMNAAGKDLHSFPAAVATFGGRLEALPNGRVLIPEMQNNRVVEYDQQGRSLWEIAVEQPIVATRLPNGHTLVTSMTQLRAIEFDREGKQVWDYKGDTRVTRALRR